MNAGRNRRDRGSRASLRHGFPGLFPGLSLVLRLALSLGPLSSVGCDLGSARPEDDDGAPDRSWIELTIGGIPESERALLILPPAGFFVDVHFPNAEEVIPETLSVVFRPWAGGNDIAIEAPVSRRHDGASFLAPEPGLAPGSHTVWATVDQRDGSSESVSLAIAVRDPVLRPPLAGGQWIHLDFEADRDRDGLADFPVDLATFGLASGASPAVDIRVESWVIDEIIQRTGALYRANPSQLPDGDPIAVVFSADPAIAGTYSRICVAGETPGVDSFIGNVLLDPGNQDRSDDACDDYLPSGVFPRELTYYADEASYQAAFGPLIEQPAGSHPLDFIALGRAYDPDDPEQRARREALTLGVETFAQAVATVVAHEAGHAMGLVPPGVPGAGLYGGIDGPEFTHNLTPAGDTPQEELLMNPGPSFGFDELTGSGGALLPHLRALNVAYLQGRVLLDARIDGVHPPPAVNSVSPAAISSDGALLEILEIRGSGFLPSPVVVLRGATDFPVLHIANLEGPDTAPDTLIGQVLAPTLLPGTYDIEVSNRDGQTATLERALEVR